MSYLHKRLILLKLIELQTDRPSTGVTAPLLMGTQEYGAKTATERLREINIDPDTSLLAFSCFPGLSFEVVRLATKTR